MKFIRFHYEVSYENNDKLHWYYKASVRVYARYLATMITVRNTLWVSLSTQFV